MSDIPDPEGGAGDRENVDVAEARHGLEEMVGTPIPTIVGAGIDLDNAMAMDSPEHPRSRTSTPGQEDRGDEMGGNDSSLTNLRGMFTRPFSLLIHWNNQADR